MVISGKDISLELRGAMRARVEGVWERYGRYPCLAVIQVGADAASTIYVRNKIKAAEYCMIESRLIALPETVREEELLAEIAQLNADAGVDGILVQLPLPTQCNEQHVIEAISPEKDVDGFHPTNASRLWQHRPLGSGIVPDMYMPVEDYACVIPCTPKGIMSLLAYTGVSLEGKHAVVVGRSDIVGKPVAKLLLDRNCTVTIAHSRTADLRSVCRVADILIVAVGKAHLIGADYIKPGAIVIDVGISRMEDGKVTGDVDFEACKDIASYITPVPGGVGPMTVTMLMQNTIDCYMRLQEKEK